MGIFKSLDLNSKFKDCNTKMEETLSFSTSSDRREGFRSDLFSGSGDFCHPYQAQYIAFVHAEHAVVLISTRASQRTAPPSVEWFYENFEIQPRAVYGLQADPCQLAAPRLQPISTAPMARFVFLGGSLYCFKYSAQVDKQR
jgi:hypothetical protein